MQVSSTRSAFINKILNLLNISFHFVKQGCIISTCLYAGFHSAVRNVFKWLILSDGEIVSSVGLTMTRHVKGGMMLRNSFHWKWRSGQPLWGSDSKTQSVSQSVSSVAQSCPTLCDPTNRSTPGLPVHHQLPEFTQTHAHLVGDATQPSHPLLSPSPPAPNPSQHQGLFQRVTSSHQVAKVLGFQLKE